jgi:hypothetical protein
VTVRDEAVAEATYEGEPIETDRVLTVEALLELLQDAYARGAERVDVTYDPEWGYPTSLYIDYDARIADEEVGYEVATLEALTG